MALVHIQTHGCAFNQADSEAMMAQLVRDGHRLTDDRERADVVVLNTCTVKNKTIANFRKNLRDIHQPIVIAGCIPEADASRKDIKNLTCIGPSHLHHITQAVEDAMSERKTKSRWLGPAKDVEASQRVSLPQTLSKDAIGIVPISKGCLSNCSYCQTKLARGDLVSFGQRRIIEKVEQMLQEGARHIWLTSQDCAVWGLDIDSDIGTLLCTIAAIPGDFKIRLGMANPLFFSRFKKNLLDAFESPNVYKFLHIPVQSGSDHVLKVMRRGYRCADFKEIVTAFRQRFPDITIATDIIVGHPGESEEDFQKTLELLEVCRPHVVNFSKFSARPGTRASQMPAIEHDIVQNRMKRLKKCLATIFKKHNDALIGWEGDVWVEQQRKTGNVVARTATYRPVIVSGDHPPGRKLHIRVDGCTLYHLTGRILP